MTEATDGLASAFPRPRMQRWQPLRSGLLNVFKYDNEVFEFEEGHLLLRGNNGTGKSRVLALQLPFLLDGELAPSRVEPDADQAKKFSWNLLMGKHEDRRGYTWIEFGRRDESGVDRFLTIGCGINAVAGRASEVDRWFFITPWRVGQELFLQSDAGQALGRRELEETIGEHGKVLTTPRSYRLEVDRQLFQLKEHRYDALVNLLIQLRQPQLSRKLDEKRLSTAMSEALAPIASTVIDDIAEAFRSMEVDRQALMTFEAAHRAVEQFLAEYQQYARIASRRHSQAVRSAHRRYEDEQRNVASSRAALAEVGQQLDELGTKLAELRLELTGAEARLQALRLSPRMHDKDELERSRDLVQQRRQDVDSASARKDALDDKLKSAKNEVRLAEDAASAARRELDERHRSVQAEFAAIGAETALARALPEVHDVPLERVSTVEREVTAALRKRREQASHLVELDDAVVKAEAALTRAKDAHQQLTEELDGASERLREAHEELQGAASALLESHRQWASSLQELRLADEWLTSLDDWAREPVGKNPVAELVEQETRRAWGELEAEHAARGQELKALRIELERLRAEETALAAGGHRPPPPPHTRSASRMDRPGAPLWRVVDFAADVNPGVHATVEAALEAAGILDAWVTPAGELLRPDDHDVIVAAGRSRPAPAARTVDRILVPSISEDDAQARLLTPEAIQDVLKHIGWGEGAGDVWVDDAGRFQVGPLAGSWAKERAEHIGQAAREAARLNRLRAVRAAIEEKRVEEERLEEQRRVLVRRQRRLKEEADELPSDDALRIGQLRHVQATEEVSRQRKRLAAQETVVLERRAALDAGMQRRADAAQDLRLTSWVGRSSALVEAIVEASSGAAQLCLALRDHARAGERRASAERGLIDVGRAAAEAATQLETTQLRQRGEAERLSALESRVGADVKAALAELEELTKARNRSATQVEERRGEETAAKVKQATIVTELSGREQELEKRSQARAAAVASFRRLLDSTLLGIAITLPSDVEADWNPTAAIALARRVEQELSDIDHGDPAWERSERGIQGHFQALADALQQQGQHAEQVLEQGLVIVTVPFGGQRCTPRQLALALVEEVRERRRVLTESERKVIEQHLVGEVAAHLHDRIRAAEDLVALINREIVDRATSAAGMRLKFRWEVVEDGPPGLEDARKRLMAASGTWSPADQAALGAFLQDQIRVAREADDAGNWRDHLNRALDYRTWHRFIVERFQDNAWKTLNRWTHGTGSGGEKAIALTIPQFAAAAAYYRSADAHAPRLIMLDEVFVGIDSDMRAKCMAMLQAFDLDFVMTSEREWGCYPSLGGLAIYQLTTRPELDAIHTTRWVWNGKEKIRSPQVVPPAARSGKRARPAAGPEQLTLLPEA